MITIPIVLTFDSNMSLPASVCISSLMMSSNEDTFYDFFVLHSGSEPEIVGLSDMFERYPNMRLQYRSVGDAFSGAYEVRGITSAAYYRLLSPELIPEYDRVIYTDVDVIFKNDLKDIYLTDLKGNYVGAVPAVGMLSGQEGKQYLKTIGLDDTNYFVSGFLLMDLAAMRNDKLVSKFKEKAKTKYKYQDQDILNLVCRDHILMLDSSVSLGVTAIHQILNKTGLSNTEYLNLTLEDAISRSNLHYNGVKPWKDWCPLMDQWWECYRKSPAYDPSYYFAFFYNKLEILDQLPLKKRIKILLRYFVYGKKTPYYNI